MGGAGTNHAIASIGTEPSNIGQAVRFNKSKCGLRWCSFLEMMADNAQDTPEHNAKNMLKPSALMCNGSKISTIPNTAETTANHCQPCTFSPNIGQANNSTQNGMV